MEVKDVWERGLYPVARAGGVTIRVHGVTLLMLFAIPMGARAEGFALAWLVTLAAHEVGHGILARAAGSRVTGFDFSPLLGLCHYSVPRTAIRRAVVAWGGVLAQFVLLVAGILLERSPLASRPFVDGAAIMLVLLNPLLLVTNLLTVEPLDGAKAWPLFPLLARPLRQRWYAWRLGRLRKPAEPKAPRSEYLN